MFMNPLIDRRHFLQSSTVAAIAALASSGLTPLWAAETAPGGKRSFKKAIHLGMIAGNMPMVDKFKLARDSGFDGLEIDSPSDLNPDEVLKACETTGVKIADIIDSVHWKDTLSDPDAEVRARGVEGLKTALKQAKLFGCGTVLLVPAVVNKQISYDQAYTRSQAEIRKAIPLAEELGVKIDIENVWNQFLLSPLEAARYVDELHSPAVGWHFDVGNIINYGFPEQWVRILNKRIGCVHVKEFSRDKRDKEGLWKGFDVELLDGDDDWPAVMKALDEVGYHGWLVAEIPGGDAQRLKVIAERMNRIVAS
jgi:L-ribulose-5-phosphate 3-epimerase